MAEGGPGNIFCQPYFLKTPDFYEITQLRQAHNEAVYAYGEYSMFILLWNITDFQAGIVQRCPNCFDVGDETTRANLIAQSYGQPAQAKCPYCYGTTFYLEGAPTLGGIKARIVRPCMWNATDEEHKRVAQGEMITSISQVQSISDFRMRSGDFVFKADGTRWRIQAHETNAIISGFQAADDVNAMVGYNYGGAVREDESSVAYIIPTSTTNESLGTILDISVVPNYPVCFEDYEIYNVTGPDALIGDAYTPGP